MVWQTPQYSPEEIWNIEYFTTPPLVLGKMSGWQASQPFQMAEGAVDDRQAAAVAVDGAAADRGVVPPGRLLPPRKVNRCTTSRGVDRS